MRIWFNRGFSLASISQSMMAAQPELEIYASVAKGMPKHAGPVETWVEPDVDAADYVAWARGQVEAYRIDLMIPTHYRTALREAQLPCRVEFPAGQRVLKLLDDKYRFAEALEDTEFHLETALIRSADELEAALAVFRARADGGAPCVKPRNGVNGFGFWKLTRDKPMRHLENPDSREIHEDLYLAALRMQEKSKAVRDMVLMEFLPGPEVSFDILAHEGRMLRYAARTKLSTGRQRIQTEHPLSGYARQLVERFALHGTVNIQFRKHRDASWKVLEINARPAGGVVYAEAVGAGILAGWAGLLTGRMTADEVEGKMIDTEVGFETAVR
ncbi:ATP-grasp domain protein [Asticcacaulis biprosthecium C19]|uniref:ATP-grasp domain protein n=1 Tax=Asticcacaulis biprosthecium C19 TaxID=715226 RepID=F4QGW0_9CAUL|nr:ATP-grasp domain-containing protein [Asticcacaulis biprosthecium]EGF93713.1 ATP-grasp domain protein [Asticcacaulis biprosthecium C19]